MRDRKALAGWCVRRAIAVGVLWAFINGTSTVNGVGLLTRQGWPFSDPFSWVGVGLVVGLIARKRRATVDRNRGHEVAEFSARSGWDFSDEVSRADVPTLPLFQSWASGRHSCRGERGGVPFQVLDVTTVGDRGMTVSNDAASLEGGKTERNRTVALLPTEGVPGFDLRPRNGASRLRGMLRLRGITFDPSGVSDPADGAEVRRFGALFEVKPIDAQEDSERALRRVFSPRQMRALNRLPGYSAQADAGRLAVWRGESFLPARERTGLLDAALAARDLRSPRRPRPAAAETVVPALPGTDAPSRAIRARNTLSGAGAGFFLGFFLNIILQISTTKLQNHGSPFFFFAIFFGGFFGSFAMGARLQDVPELAVPVKPATGRQRGEKRDALPLPTRRGDRLLPSILREPSLCYPFCSEACYSRQWEVSASPAVSQA